MAAATLIGLTKRYGSTAALDQVDLTVECGEITGLLGPNGAGKTTLLRTLLGLVTPDAGTVEVLGLPRRLDGPVHGVAGFVEAPQTWPYLTGRRTLELLAILDGGDAGELADDALDRVGLASRADTHAVPVSRRPGALGRAGRDRCPRAGAGRAGTPRAIRKTATGGA